jgi:hypothetical protein
MSSPPLVSSIEHIATLDLSNISTQDFSEREVVLVCRHVNRVILNCSQDVKTRLLETKGHAACSSE